MDCMQSSLAERIHVSFSDFKIAEDDRIEYEERLYKLLPIVWSGTIRFAG